MANIYYVENAVSYLQDERQRDVDKRRSEFRGEFTYRLDFDGTRTLFILTPAAWPIG